MSTTVGKIIIWSSSEFVSLLIYKEIVKDNGNMQRDQRKMFSRINIRILWVYLMDEYLDFSGSNLVRLQRYLKNVSVDSFILQEIVCICDKYKGIISPDSTLFLGFYFSESLIFLDRTNNQGNSEKTHCQGWVCDPAFSGYLLNSYVTSWDNAEL